jgi:hypothetical protein
MSRAMSIVSEAPLVASPKQAMRAIQVSRKKLYELINTGELESYTEGKSRRITVLVDVWWRLGLPLRYRALAVE